MDPIRIGSKGLLRWGLLPSWEAPGANRGGREVGEEEVTQLGTIGRGDGGCRGFQSLGRALEKPHWPRHLSQV